MKKTIALVTGGLQFNGDSLKTKSLGGSESAMIYMARYLAKLGNEVTVYCDCDKPGIYDNVDYRHFKYFMKDEKAQVDVCIISRFTHFLSEPIDSKLNILWIHDTGIWYPEESLAKIDKIFCLSKYQKDIFKDQYKITDDWFWNTTNGFDKELVCEPIPFQQKKNNYIYSSRFERGLGKLLQDIWPKIIEMNPDAYLNICGYFNPNVVNDDERIIKHYEEVEELIKNSKNIIDHRYLSKKKYYELLSQCGYMVYPGDFPEISCINAIEAQASECMIITSDWCALTETVKSDTKIDFDDKENYSDNFMRVIKKYQNETFYTNEVKKAKDKIQSYEWYNIAESWDKQINSLFLERFENNKERIINNLEFFSDLVAARDLTGNEKFEKLIEKSKADNDINETYCDGGYIFPGRLQTVMDVLGDFVKDLNYEVKILDVGAYNGSVSNAVIENFPFQIKQITAYEFCKQACLHLKERLLPKFKNIEVINDDIQNIQKYQIDTNFVIAGEILEHIEDTVGFLNKLMGVVKEKTVFVFTTPHGPWDMEQKDKPRLEHMHHFELNDIKEIFKETDLKILNGRETYKGRRGDVLGHWVYYFTVEPDNIPTFHKPDYQDKFIKTRPYKSVCLSMIVKNEEDNLSRCLKSVYDIVDDIVIVDTGSTDTTKDIIKRFTNNIYDYKWEEEDGLGNFSKARNFALDLCKDYDYILWMDADEELMNPRELLQYITSDYYDSILVRQRHCIVYGDDGNYDPPFHDRLFKNQGIRFRGVIHEYPSWDNDWIVKGLFQNAVFIAHYGTINKPKRENKITDSYSDLIEKNYRVYPNCIMAKYYYMGLLASRIYRSGDMATLPLVLDLWNNSLVASGDIWVAKKGFPFIQDLYAALLHNNVKLPGGDLTIREYENENKQKIQVIASSDKEFDLFMKIISNQALTR